MTESLSIEEARKLVLLSQRIPPLRQAGSAVAATLSAIEHLGYVQIDTISVIQRAHHHTLWNRNPRYKEVHLDQLVSGRNVYEYWSHAAAYLPMCDYRYSLPRKRAIARGEQSHWYVPDQKLKKLMKVVRERISAEGPLMAKDFENTGKKCGEWSLKPAKQALECLFMQGDLMISSRVNFHKVYDLTERVLPEGLDVSFPNADEYARHLITRFLQANGLGKDSEVSYLLKGTKSLVSKTIDDMVSAGELMKLQVGGAHFYTLPSSLKLLNKPLSRSKLKILSPFDNLVIQRKRMIALFDFDYQIECYVPQGKRRYGYFSLPILWDGKLVARMDCKAEKKDKVMRICHLALESSLSRKDAFVIALQKELEAFLRFNRCERLEIGKTTPASLKGKLRIATSELVI